MRLVIVEDQLMFREALRKVCEGELGHRVIGESGLGEEGVKLTLQLRPDVLLLDLSLPDIDGFTVADRVLAEAPDMRILILSSHSDDYTLFRVEQSDVHGFVDKNSNTATVLSDALRAVEAGNSYYSASYLSRKRARRVNPIAFDKTLTDWERELLALIGLGMSDDEVARNKRLSPRTVQTHRSNLLRKLRLPNTPKLIRYAVEHGFTQVPPPSSKPPVEP